MASAIDDPGQVHTGDPVVDEAIERFKRCAEWESPWRERFINDLKFANGDSDNGYQWPNSVRRNRDVDQRPCLTINMIRQHNLMIVNEAKQHKTGVKIRGTGGGASKESADVFMGLVRRIEYKSRAQDAYSTAMEFQVEGGIGWWRLVTQYESPDSWDQDVRILRVADPLSVFMDPDCQEKDCSDARYAFVFDDVPRDEFEEAYPQYANLATADPLGDNSGDNYWISMNHVRVCEYFRRVPKEDWLYSFVDPASGKRRAIRKSKMPANMVKAVEADSMTKRKRVWEDEIQWKLIAGEQVIDETTWPGKYIPLIRIIGEESTINGILDRKGHTRNMKDAQRMYNYNASGQVEFVALQSKTPWIAPAKAIEELETMWNTANVVNHSVLPWNHVDDEGNPVPPPFRQEPPAAAPAFQVGMDTAFNQMMMSSGQWQNQMGMLGNERTGAAIDSRKSQGDRATYHFVDNFNVGIRFTGMQLIDLIPKIYDTRRVMKAIAPDGTDFEVEIDPSLGQAYLAHLDHDNQVVRRIFNPKVGEYDVEADIGPAYATKRDETVAALSTILTQAPTLVPLIGDLLLRAMDFPLSDEAAERLRRMVPPQAMGRGPTQVEQLLQQRNSQLEALLAKTLRESGRAELKLVGKDQMRDIDAYKAETDRMQALVKLLPGVDPEGLKSVIDQLVQDSLATHLTAIQAANRRGIENQAGAA